MFITYDDLPKYGVPPYSKAQLKRLSDDGHFPKPVQFGGPKSKNFWVAKEVEDFIAALKAARHSEVA